MFSRFPYLPLPPASFVYFPAGKRRIPLTMSPGNRVVFQRMVITEMIIWLSASTTGLKRTCIAACRIVCY